MTLCELSSALCSLWFALLRFAGEGGAWDLLEVVDESEGVPAGEQRGDGVTLAVTDFEGEQASGFECGARLGDEAAIDFEAVRTGKERGGGFEVANLGMQSGAVGGGDVGRIGDDGVPPQRAKTARRGPRSVEGGFAGCECVEQVGFDEADAAGEVVAGGIR